MAVEIVCADVTRWAKDYDGPPFHAMLCDPPYELAFMGKSWDASGISFHSDTWAALAEHLLPGAFILAFASSRGWHRQAVAMEDAGLVMHPTIFLWAYGSGFPKATRIDTAVDKAAGKKREVVGEWKPTGTARPSKGSKRHHAKQTTGALGTIDYDDVVLPITVPATPLAAAWAGHRYGLQCLKPAVEPVLCFQKPYGGKPVDVITKTGAGALNIEKGRIGVDVIITHGGSRASTENWRMTKEIGTNHSGRWPANFILSHLPECRQVGVKQVTGTGTAVRNRGVKGGNIGPPGAKAVGTPDMTYADADGLETVAEWQCAEECPVKALDEQSGISHEHLRVLHHKSKSGFVDDGNGFETTTHADSGGASRFFFNADWSLDIAERLAGVDAVRYCAKAGRREREAGLEGTRVQLRQDLTPEQIEYVKTELERCGVNL